MQHSQQTDIHTGRDSKTQSQQSGGVRPTPQTARPQGLAPGLTYESKIEAKLPHYFITEMALVVLHRGHYHADPINGHPLENLKLIVEKHDCKYCCLNFIRFVTLTYLEFKWEVNKY